MDGDLHGYGRIVFQDGGVYRGMFKENLPNGKGRNVYASGLVEEGYFKDGKFVE